MAPRLPPAQRRPIPPIRKGRPDSSVILIRKPLSVMPELLFYCREQYKNRKELRPATGNDPGRSLDRQRSRVHSVITMRSVQLGAEMVFALALLMTPAAAPRAFAQMMGSHMGPMMRPGSMESMRSLMAWLNGAELNTAPSQPEPRIDSQMRSVGKTVYNQHCAVCHGDKGDGKGPQAAGLKPPPRNFTTGVYKFRSTPSGTLPIDQDLWKTISDGLHGTSMVPWISLSENQRWAVAAYIEAFSPRFSVESRGTPVAVAKPSLVTPEMIERGRKLYQQDCAQCHGAKGQGNGPAMSTVTHGSRPRDFTRGLFKRGSSLEDIYLTLHTGVDGTPMLTFGRTLTSEQSWAVAAYVRTFIARPARSMGMMGPMMAGGGANDQERKGMMIDMPGMAAMR
jgi:cytochrome c oxidase cbb3-type subunit 2